MKKFIALIIFTFLCSSLISNYYHKSNLRQLFPEYNTGGVTQMNTYIMGRIILLTDEFDTSHLKYMRVLAKGVDLPSLANKNDFTIEEACAAKLELLKGNLVIPMDDEVIQMAKRYAFVRDYSTYEAFGSDYSSEDSAVLPPEELFNYGNYIMNAQIRMLVKDIEDNKDISKYTRSTIQSSNKN
jgi:hypothetical protein